MFGSFAGLAGESLQKHHYFVDNVGIALLYLLYDARFHVVAHDEGRNAMHCAFNGRKLGKHVTTIAVVVNHRFDAIELANDAVEPFLKVVLHVVAARRCLVTAGAWRRYACIVLLFRHNDPFKGDPAVDAYLKEYVSGPQRIPLGGISQDGIVVVARP